MEWWDWTALAVVAGAVIWIARAVLRFNAQERATKVMILTFGPAFAHAEQEYAEYTGWTGYAFDSPVPQRPFSAATWLSDFSLGFLYEVANRAAMLALPNGHEKVDNIAVVSLFLYRWRNVPQSSAFKATARLADRPTDGYQLGRASAHQYLMTAARFGGSIDLLYREFSKCFSDPMMEVAMTNDGVAP